MNPAAPVATLDLLLAHHGWMRDLARRLVLDPNRADDLEQQAWLAALQSPPTQGVHPRAWLATVLRNLVREGHRRDERRLRRERAAARSESLPGTSEVVAHAEAHGRLVRAVLALPEPFRETVLLRFYEGCPPREVARRLGIPVETVRSRTRRALERLRGDLDGEHGGDRRAWCLALLPLAGLDGNALAASGLGKGALLMSVGTKKGLVAVGLVAAGVGLWVGVGTGTASDVRSPAPAARERPAGAEPPPAALPESPVVPVAADPPVPPPPARDPPEPESPRPPPLRAPEAPIPAGPGPGPGSVPPVVTQAPEPPAPAPVATAAVKNAEARWERDTAWTCEQIWKLSKSLRQNGLAWTADALLHEVFTVDPDHAATREYFGYERTAQGWRWNDAARDTFRSQIDEEDPLARFVLDGRRRLAEGLCRRWNADARMWQKSAAASTDPGEAAAFADLARRAHERVLLFEGDGPTLAKLHEQAHAALGHPEIDGRFVTPYQAEMLRARGLRRETVQRLTAAPRRVEPIPPGGLFAQSGLSGAGARADHFAVHTVHDQATADRLCGHMERALDYAAAVWGLSEDTVEGRVLTAYLGVRDEAEMRRVIDGAGTDWTEAQRVAFARLGGTALPGGVFVGRSAAGGPDADDQAVNVAILYTARRARERMAGAQSGPEDWLWQSLATDASKHLLGTTLTRWGAFGDYGRGFQAAAGVDEWIALARRQVRIDDDVPLARMHRLTLAGHDFRGREMVKGFAFLQFVLETEPQRGPVFIRAALAEGTPAAAVRVFGPEILGERMPQAVDPVGVGELPAAHREVLETLDARYRDWILRAW